MRASLAAFLVAGAACASTPQPKGTPTSFQPVCLPCPMPCSPETSCPQPVVAKPPAPPPPAPAPAPAPVPEPKKEPAAAPTFSPAPGESTGSQMVTLSSATPNAVIRYTTDGSPATESSPEYKGPITVDKTTTIQAIAIAPGLPNSAVTTGAYTVTPPTPPPTPRVVVTREKLELKEKVFFDTGKATIKPQSFGLLDEVAAALKGHDEVKKVRIEGYTDSAGGAALNQKLSQERAEAVREYLVGKGIDGARLDAQGFGPKSPLASNKTAKGREENRRVELRIVE